MQGYVNEKKKKKKYRDPEFTINKFISSYFSDIDSLKVFLSQANQKAIN